MKELLKLIEQQLRGVNTIVTCPICEKKQSFKLNELSAIRLGEPGGYTGTGGMPMIQCKHCKAEGRTTLIQMNECFYAEISKIVIYAIEKQPAKYVKAKYEDTIVCVSKGEAD